MTSPPLIEPTPKRFFEIDLVKAVSIIAVVLIHSMRSPWVENVHALEIWLGHTLSFAVPAFMAASGFLWAKDQTSELRRSTLQRLRRLVVPYVVVSVTIHMLRAATGAPVTAAMVVESLLFASTYHVYYYIFVAVVFALSMPLLCRIPSRIWPVVTMLLVGASLISRGLGWGADAFYIVPFDWYLRNPFLFAGYFAIGWLARLHYSRLQSRIVADRILLLLLLGGAVGFCLVIFALPVPMQIALAAHWEYHYAAIALLFVIACGMKKSAPIVRFLSDATYAIFLIHPVCIAGANRILTINELVTPFSVGSVRFVIGLLGSIGIIWAFRRLLPRFSRDLVGA